MVDVRLKTIMKKTLEQLRDHAKRWKDSYELIGVFLAVAVSCIAIWQTSKALRIQADEYHLRNRPIVDITDAAFDELSIDSSSGKTFPHSVALRIDCVSDVPATKFRALCEAYINSNKVTVTDMTLGALANGKTSTAFVFLEEDVYALATNAANHFFITLDARYSGMLGEPDDAYGVTCVITYFPLRKEFGFRKRTYR
jgi:hypothetical protein